MAIRDPWRDLLVEPVSREHFVQVYRDDRVLVEAVSLYAGAAFGRNEAAVLVTTRRHAEAVAQRLDDDGFDVATLVRWGQLSMPDAEEVLSRFMVAGMPDEGRFKAAMQDLVASKRASGRFRVVRVYGEMVDLLWSDNLPAAARLEELWNDAIEEHSISLFCSYCLDGGGRGERVFPPALRAPHAHFIPVEAGGA